ncbi:MAG: aminoacyl-histidine dipeptidase [Promethearchaeota archaeon]|nr:MAG: aminoacyl-histidine dipeptidase [Candidatus Lokiarchaeota archaeon]
MEELKHLGSPIEFWEYFYEISKIPRCSGNEGKIREYINNEAKRYGFETEIDDVKNLLVKIPSKKDDSITVVLQSHMDIVCEKNKESHHDFSRDPLELESIELGDEKWITAKGTTLGADNGVGIAYQLAIMQLISSKKLNLDTINLKLLFTVDEEMGLKGASQLNREFAKGDFLINLDSEDDKTFTVGCAGGIQFRTKFKIYSQPIDDKNLIPIKIQIKGLLGGHSGVDIDKGRGHSVKFISQILWNVNKEFEIHISSIDGGNLSNAIPRESQAILFIHKAKKEDLFEFVNHHYREIKKLYNGIEPNINLVIEKLDKIDHFTIMAKKFQDTILNLFYVMPTGPLYFHPKIKGLVHTSMNFATIKTREQVIKTRISIRSISNYDKEILHDKILTLMNLANVEYQNYKYVKYPSWPPKFDSKLNTIARQVYKDLFDEEVEIQAIHAGLECAYFSDYFPEMEVMSFGPDIKGGHSPDERLRVKSVSKIWNILITLLKKLD